MRPRRTSFVQTSAVLARGAERKIEVVGVVDEELHVLLADGVLLAVRDKAVEGVTAGLHVTLADVVASYHHVKDLDHILLAHPIDAVLVPVHDSGVLLMMWG